MGIEAGTQTCIFYFNSGALSIIEIIVQLPSH
jgi:hypothetical protein